MKLFHKDSFEFPGFRPTALVLFSLIWFSVGASIVSREPGSEANHAEANHALPLELLPIWVRVALWWGPAACGLVAAWWPPGRDRWGWALLSVPATFRVVSYGFAAALGWIDPTYALSWSVIVGVLVLVAFWPEPPKGKE